MENCKRNIVTFLFSKSILNKFRQNIRLVGERENSPFEKPLHEIFDQIPCLAPIKSTSYHLSRTVPGIESEWLDLWKKIMMKFMAVPREIEPLFRG